MFDVPTNPKIEKCIITKETVEKKAGPELVINENKEKKDISSKVKKEKVNTENKTA